MESPTIAHLFDLSGKVALVTGGTMGIGQAIAFRLAEAGAAVMIADIDLEGAGKTVKEIKSRGGSAHAVRADISDTSAAGETVRSTIEAFGRLDILVNNAGIYPFKPFLEISEQDWDRVLDINLKGTFFFSQAAAREMIEAGRGGKIINMASRGGISPRPNMSHYGASKAGVCMLTKSLALELAPHNILVNAVTPAVVVTPGTLAQVPPGQTADQQGSDSKAGSMMARIPLQRFGYPDDIAGVALFLASGASDYITGSLIMVDGGYELS